MAVYCMYYSSLTLLIVHAIHHTCHSCITSVSHVIFIKNAIHFTRIIHHRCDSSHLPTIHNWAVHCVCYLLHVLLRAHVTHHTCYWSHIVWGIHHAYYSLYMIFITHAIHFPGTILPTWYSSHTLSITYTVHHTCCCRCWLHAPLATDANHHICYLSTTCVIHLVCCTPHYYSCYWLHRYHIVIHHIFNSLSS